MGFLTQLSANPEQDFLDTQVTAIMDKTFAALLDLYEEKQTTEETEPAKPAEKVADASAPRRGEDGRVEDDVFEPKQEWDGVPKPVTQMTRDRGQKEESTEVPEPIIKDEDPKAERDESEQIDSTTEAEAKVRAELMAKVNNVVAKVEELDVAPEVREVDQLLEVKAWAMQSPGWKMLNVLFETFSDEQLQYTCKNGKSVFENMALLLKLALTNGAV